MVGSIIGNSQGCPATGTATARPSRGQPGGGYLWIGRLRVPPELFVLSIRNERRGAVTFRLLELLVEGLCFRGRHFASAASKAAMLSKSADPHIRPSVPVMTSEHRKSTPASFQRAAHSCTRRTASERLPGEIGWVRLKWIMGLPPCRSVCDGLHQHRPCVWFSVPCWSTGEPHYPHSQTRAWNGTSGRYRVNHPACDVLPRTWLTHDWRRFRTVHPERIGWPDLKGIQD